MSACCDYATPTVDWQDAFLAILPAIERQARWAVSKCPPGDRDEAQQSIIAYAAIAYARLVRLGRSGQGTASSLARYGLQRYRSGRWVGGRLNVNDVGSSHCQRRRRFKLEPLDDCQQHLVYARGATPAEIAAVRLDFSAWLDTLTGRNRQLAGALAQGEATSAVATMFEVSATRVSQLRRELLNSWRQFIGETGGVAR